MVCARRNAVCALFGKEAIFKHDKLPAIRGVLQLNATLVAAFRTLRVSDGPGLGRARLARGAGEAEAAHDALQCAFILSGSGA